MYMYTVGYLFGFEKFSTVLTNGRKVLMKKREIFNIDDVRASAEPCEVLFNCLRVDRETMENGYECV